MSSTVYCLHSSQSHGGQFRSLLKSLPEGCEGIAPDLIGYGKGEPLTVSDTDFWLQTELDALEKQNKLPPEGSVIVGHSYGGAIALRWARLMAEKHPEQVKALILYEPVAFHILKPEEPGRAEIEAVAAKMKQHSEAQACEAFVDYWNKPGYFSRLPEKAQRFMISQQRKVTADFHALLEEPVAAEDYANIQCPVLLMHGQKSPMSSRSVVARLAEVLPACETAVVDSGHMGPLTHPNLVNPVILDRLSYWLNHRKD